MVRPIQLFSLAFGTIVGIAWVPLIATWLSGAGAFGTSAAIALGAVAMLPIAACYVRLAGRFPGRGGEIQYVGGVFGERAGFVAGWLLLLCYVAVTAFHHPTFEWIAAVAVDSLHRGTGVALPAATPFVLSTALFLIVVIANLRGIDFTLKIQDLTVLILILASVSLFGGSILVGRADNVAPLFGDGPRLSGLMGVLATVPFLFAGYNTAVQAIGDLDPRHQSGLRIALFGAIAAAACFYIGIVLAIAVALPRHQLLALPLPALDVFGVAFKTPLATFAAACVALLALTTSWNGVFFAATRVLASLLSDGRRERDIPHRSGRQILAVGLLSAALAVPGPLVIDPIIAGVSMTFALLFFMISLAALRDGMPDERLPLLASVLAGAVVVLAGIELAGGSYAIVKAGLLIAWCAIGVVLAIRLRPKAA